MSILAISALILGALGVLACFVPRLPGVLASYAGLSCAWFAGADCVDGSVLMFWFVAVAIVLGIMFLFVAVALVLGIRAFAPCGASWTRRGNPYVAVGVIVGSLLGYVSAPTEAAVITGGVIGAFLGALAFRSTPLGPKEVPVFSPDFINFLGVDGLRAVVTCSICGIIAASIL